MPRSLAASIDAWRRRLRGPTAAAHGAEDPALERPWLGRWDHLPKRTAGPGFSREDYAAARARAREVARATLGEEMWERLARQGYLDVPSRRVPGMTYRLRVGRRIELRCAPGVRSPWHERGTYWSWGRLPTGERLYLCINPTYPLPEEEFFAHLYLYVRDDEALVLKVAAPQPWDDALGRTF